jgi:hypothetical protein
MTYELKAGFMRTDPLDKIESCFECIECSRYFDESDLDEYQLCMKCKKKKGLI